MTTKILFFRRNTKCKERSFCASCFLSEKKKFANRRCRPFREKSFCGKVKGPITALREFPAKCGKVGKSDIVLQLQITYIKVTIQAQPNFFDENFTCYISNKKKQQLLNYLGVEKNLSQRLTIIKYLKNNNICQEKV